MTSLNQDIIGRIILPLPPKNTQERIVDILSAYDDLIENNTRRIQILEEMAQAIYREWFVHFRYPGHEGTRMVESELGMIPEGWKVKPVAEAFETLGGGTPSTKISEYWENGDVTWFTPTDLTRSGSMFVMESEKKISTLGLKNSAAKMFPAYSVMMTSRATIGVTALNTSPACTNQGFITWVLC
jgi:type I restriction enzyme S subunit